MLEIAENLEITRDFVNKILILLLWFSPGAESEIRTKQDNDLRTITKMDELKSIMEKFVASGWDLISVPAQQWLDGKADKDVLASAIKQTNKECGSCGCDLDPLYKRALELI